MTVEKLNSFSTFLAQQKELPNIGVYHGFENFTKMNLFRSVISLLFRGYAESTQSRWEWNSGIAAKELQAAYMDFRSIGIELGFFDPRVFNMGSRSFVEGNLFTYASDGIRYQDGKIVGELNFIEMMQFSEFLISGGKTGLDIYLQTEASCKQKSEATGKSVPIDFRDKPMVLRSCVQKHLAEAILTSLTHAPGLVKYISGLSAEKRTKYMSEMLATVHSPASVNPQWVELSEFGAIAVVAQYAEAVLTRFDHDLSGTLDNQEIEEALPVFVGFIKNVAETKMGLKNLSDNRARAAFLYVLAYKKIPVSWKDKGMVWIYQQFHDPTLNMDRFELQQAFHAIFDRIMTQN